MMPASIDARPPGLNCTFRRGTTLTMVLNWPAGALTGRTFTATLNGTSLSLVNAGDAMTITVTAAQTGAVVNGTVLPFVLTETTGDDQPILTGSWRASDRPNAVTTETVELTLGAAEVTVELASVSGTGDLAVGGDLTMASPVFPGDGTVHDGIIRQTHSIQIPWTYTQSVDPTDSAIGTAVLVDADVTLSDGDAFGPQFQTGFFGPRAVFQFEGLVRYGKNLSALSLAPNGFGDFVTVANTAGVARTLNYAWPFLVGRTILADGATVTLGASDVNQGGAAFVDSSIYATVDGGTIDGTTSGYEHVSFHSMPGIGGNTALTRRIGFDVRGAYEGMHPGIPEPTGPHWSGAGNWDATTPTLNEEIGLRIQGLNLGTTKIGAQIFSTAIANLSTSPVIGMQIGMGIGGASTQITVNDTGGGFRTGNNVIGIQMQPTVIYDQDGGAITAFSGWSSAPILKNAAGEARTIPLAQSIATRHVYRGDGALLTVTSHVGFQDIVAADVISAGTVTVTSAVSFDSQATPAASTTYTTRKGFNVLDGTGAGSIGTQVGLDIAALAKGTTNIGIRNASTYVATPLAQTLSAAGNAITATAEVKALTNSTGGSLTLTSAPTIADGQTGQEIELVNVGAQDIVIQDQGTLASSNLRLTATTLTLQPRDSVRLRFNSSIGDWVQCGPLVNVL
jgi:hypothetical protein